MISPFENMNLILVAAHPDDEILFAGAQFSHLASLAVVHVTDGAPSDRIARQRGFPNRAAYANARNEEFTAALRVAGINARHESFGLQDGRACLRIDVGVRRLAALIDQLRPDLILTHAYDGGHIDHDTVSAIAQLAVRLSKHHPKIWEMAGYFYRDCSDMIKYCFPSGADKAAIVYRLSREEKQKKSQMLACFRSQKNTVDLFPDDIEVFRSAPSYDFKKPPVSGRLSYEVAEAGIESALWRMLVRLNAEALNDGVNLPVRLILARIGMRIVIASTKIRRNHPRIAGQVVRLYVTFLGAVCPASINSSAP